MAKAEFGSVLFNTAADDILTTNYEAVSTAEVTREGYV
jgi:hypothetical protein